MALKDWKRSKSLVDYVSFINKKKEEIILVYKIYKDWEGRYDKVPRWQVSIGGSLHGKILKDYLKNKNEALAFAIDYMKVH